MEIEEISAERAELLELRARITVTERAAWLGIEVAAMIRPEQTLAFLEQQRELLAGPYAEPAPSAAHLSEAERKALAKSVDEKFEDLLKSVKEAARMD